MSVNRREFLNAGLAAGCAGALTGATAPVRAAAAGYRALVVVFLDGGNDGHNCLVPIDGGYADYQTSRANLALAKSTLLELPGTVADRRFGMHPALSPLVPLYSAGRLAWIANVGPLIEPSTARQVLDGAVDVPPFMFSHPDQSAFQQGWTADVDQSGWGGRALELLPNELRHPLAAATMGTQRTLVQGRRSAVSYIATDRMQYWGQADLRDPSSAYTQRLRRMASWRHANRYANEYSITLEAALNDSLRTVEALPDLLPTDASFGSDGLGVRLRLLSALLPGFKANGLRRQVFMVGRSGFDTHANQRGSEPGTQDAQLSVVAQALSAFDAATVRAGLDGEVTTLVMSDFGRTLRPGSGGGSEHGWGNHWVVMGGAIQGRTVHGRFPSLVLGGVDDGDNGRNGRHVPTTGTDQVGATLVRWLGLPEDRMLEVFPNLTRFVARSVPIFRG